MDPYEKKLLEETVELSRENNKMLRSIRSATRWAQFFSLIKWIIIIGLTVGTYYYIQPYLMTMLKIYSELGGSSIPSINAIQQDLKNFQGIDSYFHHATTTSQ